MSAISTVPMPTLPPSSEPDHEHAALEHRAHDPEAVPARGDRGHQPVARSGPETGADVEAAAEAEADDREREERDADRERVLVGDQREAEVRR